MSYQIAIEKLENLSIREKWLIGLTVAAFLVSLLQILVVDPRLSKIASLDAQLQNSESGNQRLALELEGKLLMPRRNRQLLLHREVEALQEQLEFERQRIESQTASLVPASKIPRLLQELVTRDSVEMVGLQNIAPVSLLEEADFSEDEAIQLFHHGIELELRGSYHSLRRYLIEIEKQPWKLLWRAVHFETEQQGNSLMRLELQTLSTDDAWLGV